MKSQFTAFIVLLAATHSASAQNQAPRQEHAALRLAAEGFLETQMPSLPGKASFTVGAIDARLSLPACASAPEAFLPPGARLWGKTMVGVRCAAPSPWTVYVPAAVRVQGAYLTAAVPLAAGQTIVASDIAMAQGELTALPAGVATDPAQAIGRSLAMAAAPGQPLRQDALRTRPAVQQGQTVKLVSEGAGFSVSAEARALANANEGQLTQARTAGGQVVSGVARAGGIVAVPN